MATTTSGNRGKHALTDPVKPERLFKAVDMAKGQNVPHTPLVRIAAR